MNRGLIVKMTVIFLITVGAVVWGLNFFLTEGKKSRASGETMTYFFVPDNQNVDANQEFHVLIKVEPSLTIMTRGYSFVTKFAKDKLELKKVEYKLGTVSQGLGQTDANLTAINNQGQVKLVGEINAALGSPMTVGTKTELVDLTFKYTGTGEATGSVYKPTAVVYWYKTDGTLVEISAENAATFSINGSNQPSVTPGGPTVTGGAGDNVKLKLKLRFQGIRSKPPTDALSKMKVKFRLYDENTEIYIDKDNSIFTSNENGIWIGEADFNVNVNHKFALLVKGPFHVQKRVCKATPTETDDGTYRCAKGDLELVAGDNDINMSGIFLLTGDLPETNGVQSGIVDAYDISLVRNCLGKTDADCLKNADVNRDGKCTVQDYSLIIAALSIRHDEL